MEQNNIDENILKLAQKFSQHNNECSPKMKNLVTIADKKLGKFKQKQKQKYNG